MPTLWMVFDVESIGLHGEGFAVGWVVVDVDGNRLNEGIAAAPPDAATGSDAGRAWVAEHVPPLSTHAGCTPRCIRTDFWVRWRSWAEQGAVLVSDCGWPVEARFLAACVDDAPDAREWQGPYPLHELASFMVAAGMDPMATYDRLGDEPRHDPLGDAKQAARLLVMALGRLAPAR